MRIQASLIVGGLLFFGAAGVLSAHKDRKIAIDGTALIGLPPEFTPAALDVAAGSMTVGKHRMHFTPYLRAFFSGEHASDLRITASWYHERQVLPPYICIEIFPRQRDFSYALLFNLETMDLIRAEVVVRASTNAGRSFRIDIAEEERDRIRQSIEVIH